MGTEDHTEQAGAGSMMVARPDDAEELIVWHPENHLTASCQVVVQENESAVFFLHGAVLGLLGPGRHTLSTATHPFLQSAASPDGQGFDVQVGFVREQGTLKAGGRLTIVPPEGEMLELRCFGPVNVRVSDPQTLVVLSSGEPVDRQLGSRAMRSLGPMLQEMVDDGRAVPGQLAASIGQLQAMAQRDGLGLGDFGLEVLGFGEVKIVGDRQGPAAEPAAAPAAEPMGGAVLAPGARVTVAHGGTQYAGSVAQVQGTQCEVRWDGGAVSWIAADQLQVQGGATAPAPAAPTPAAPAGPAPGQRVLAQWGSALYGATVQQVAQGLVEVAWDNGQRTWLRLDQIRPA